MKDDKTMEQNNINDSFLNSVLADYDKVKKQKNHIPRRYELSQSSIRILQKMDIPWSFVLEVKGDIDNAPTFTKRRVTREKVIKDVQALYQKLGYPPHPNQYKGYPGARSRFNGWHDLIRACGIKATYYSETTNISKEEILYRVGQLIKKEHRFPSSTEIYSPAVPSNCIRHYWKSIDDLAAEFDLRSYRSGNTIHSEEQLISVAKRMYKKGIPFSVHNLCQEANWSSKEFTRVIGRINLQNKRSHSIKKYLLTHGFDPDWVIPKIQISGKKYSSWEEAATDLHMSTTTLRNRVKKYENGNNIMISQEQLKLQSKYAIILNGVTYKSISEAARLHGINSETLTNRVRKFGHNSPFLFERRLKSGILNK